MLMPHPATLRKLVGEYEALVAHQAGSGAVKAGQRVQDLAYTLCVSTGTRDVDLALKKARSHIAAAEGSLTPLPLRPAAPGSAEVRDVGRVRDAGEVHGVDEAVA
ncbi:DUF5133 domain-containing protein [Streptomyces dioscori]|uniref:DUF5133 domain-containing protein n=1 Tax=Streptomyces dioscori TaxID=2109333 RepID=A0A2P8Q8Y0_9ACTN|nr:DUF5133 domain-containing protein [Streptomyces dioscori]PSM42707.1 DUF5133 domain-containing protein [Streptomyces dioscori]